ncbi:MAG: indole-3-glycerol phosphate synthase TrpC [Candidatus Eremiobacteraeota bacterium]|nr:indole-3-glycerol phosphate synthase TrpC [Candidatus Eremiobacteraeota bacterium]
MNRLRAIVQLRHADIKLEKKRCDLRRLALAAAARTDRRDFVAALRERPRAIVAEIKRASPSAGPLRPGCDAASRARAYADGGAAALSVLTEQRHFCGSWQDLRRAKDAAAIPVLCKDFVVDEYQIWQAAVHGADAVLLIVAALDDTQLVRFQRLCDDLVLAALVEVHDALDVQRALAAQARLIGLNNRDLATFAVDTDTAIRLRTLIPAQLPVVAESGYHSAAQLARVFERGVDAVLMGEALMRATEPQRHLRELMDACSHHDGRPAWSA